MESIIAAFVLPARVRPAVGGRGQRPRCLACGSGDCTSARVCPHSARRPAGRRARIRRPCRAPPPCRPQQDLKSLQAYKQKIQSGASLARQSVAMPAGAGGASLLGTPRLDGLIRAVHPLAESVPNSARSTPRDWGGAGAPDGAPPAAAPLQQQYQQAAAAGVGAAPYAQQQQYSKAQLPPGPPLSRHGSMGGGGGAAREGSVRGGLAGLADKMMGGVGGQMDRLRRLSSGHYQQQQQQQQQQYQPPGYY